MDNDSIFSGVRAAPAREVADGLHFRGWDSNNGDFLALVGAVTTLAREVDRITPVVIDHDAGPARDLAAQLALVYAGLREVAQMLETGHALALRETLIDNRVYALGGVIQAVQARLFAMLEAGGIESTDDQFAEGDVWQRKT